MSKAGRQSDRQIRFAGIGLQSLLFLALLSLVILSQNYALYNINHYKLVVALAGCFVFLLSGLPDWFRAPAHSEGAAASYYGAGISYFAFFILLLPIIATLPGFFLSGGAYAYFFEQELVVWLVCCCWLYLMVVFFDYDTHIVVILAGMAALVCMSSLMSMANYSGAVEGIALDVLNRESGTFGNPNYFAAYLSMQLPLFIVCALPAVHFNLPSSTVKALKLLFIAATVSGVAALLLTQARAAQLTFLACLLLLYLFMLAQPKMFGISRRLLLWIMCVMGVLFVALIVFLPIADYLLERLRTGSTASSRLVPWRAAWASITEAPWFGWGAGSSYSLFFEYVDAGSRIEWFQRKYPHAHNDYLETLQEGGLFALSAFAALTAYFGRMLYRLFTSPAVQTNTKLILSGLCLGILSYYVLALVSVATRMISVKLIFFLFLAIVLLLYKSRISQAEKGKAGRQVGFSALLFRTMPSRLIQASVLALLLISVGLYASVGSSRLQYVEIIQSTSGSEKMAELRALRDSNPNIYATEALLSQELLAGDIASAKSSIAVMNSLIPNYENVGYLEAVLGILSNDLAQARELAEKYQKRDLYHAKTAMLLLKIALLEDDPALLRRQLTLVMQSLLIQDSTFDLHTPEQVQLSLEGDTITASLSRVNERQELIIMLGESTTQEIMQLGSQVLQQTGNTLLGEQYSSLINDLVTQSYFAGFTEAQESALRTHLAAALRETVSQSI